MACPTRKAFIANLRLEHAYTANGAFDPVDLEAGFGKEFACAYYVKVVNKKFVPQFGGKQQCGKPIHYLVITRQQASELRRPFTRQEWLHEASGSLRPLAKKLGVVT